MSSVRDSAGVQDAGGLIHHRPSDEVTLDLIVELIWQLFIEPLKLRRRKRLIRSDHMNNAGGGNAGDLPCELHSIVCIG